MVFKNFFNLWLSSKLLSSKTLINMKLTFSVDPLGLEVVIENKAANLEPGHGKTVNLIFTMVKWLGFISTVWRFIYVSSSMTTTAGFFWHHSNRCSWGYPLKTMSYSSYFSMRSFFWEIIFSSSCSVIHSSKSKNFTGNLLLLLFQTFGFRGKVPHRSCQLF